MEVGKVRPNELMTAATPAPSSPSEPTARTRQARDRFRASQAAQAEFEQRSSVGKGWSGVKMGASMVPGMFKAIASNPKVILNALVDPYLHPFRSVEEANKAFNASRKQGPIEAGLTGIKAYGGLVSAWMMPVSLALAPFTGGASLFAGAAGLLGASGLAATGASLVKNTVDAATSDTQKELDQQATEIAADGVGLATAAATTAAAKGVQQAVKAVAHARDPFTRAQKTWYRPGEDGMTDGVERGNTRIGKAVNQAVARSDEQTVGTDKIFTRGSIEEIWMNSFEDENLAMRRLAHEIRHGTSKEAILQTFCVYGDSSATDEVLRAVADRQKLDPDFRLILMHTGEVERMPINLYSYGTEAALKKHGVKAYVGEYISGPTAKINHSKSYVLDRQTAIFGGKNIQTAPEQDMLIKAKGDVVAAFVDDARSAWVDSKKRYYFDGERVHQNVDLPELFEDLPVDPVKARPTKPQVDMTILSKRAAADSGANAGLITAIKHGRTIIKAKTPNLNEEQALDAAIEAARNGAKVQLLVSRDHNAVKSFFSGGTNRQTVRRLAKLPQDVRDRIEVRWHSPDGKNVQKSHTKYVSVDGEWAYLGSQNLDRQSFRPSREIGVGVDDALTTQDLDAQVFDRDWATGVVAKPTSFWHDLTEQVPFLQRFHRPID